MMGSFLARRAGCYKFLCGPRVEIPHFRVCFLFFSAAAAVSVGATNCTAVRTAVRRWCRVFCRLGV